MRNEFCVNVFLAEHEPQIPDLNCCVTQSVCSSSSNGKSSSFFWVCVAHWSSACFVLFDSHRATEAKNFNLCWWSIPCGELIEETLFATFHFRRANKTHADHPEKWIKSDENTIRRERQSHKQWRSLRCQLKSIRYDSLQSSQLNRRTQKMRSAHNYRSQRIDQKRKIDLLQTTSIYRLRLRSRDENSFVSAKEWTLVSIFLPGHSFYSLAFSIGID